MRFLTHGERETAYLEDKRPNTDCVIVVNGETIVIHKNLFYPLSHLGSKIRAGHGRLWVDFLCINQSDLNERSSQVRLMKDIFGNASQVLAWLGAPPEDHLAKDGVELIHNISTWVTAYNIADSEKWVGVAHKYEIQDEIAVHLPCYPDDKNRPAWRSPEWITAREFWQRTWIYQEVASELTVFHVGRYSFTAGQLDDTEVVLGVYDRRTDFEYRSTFSSISPLSNARETCRGITDDGDFWGSQRSQLLVLLRTSRTSFGTDPRDKVFAARPHAVDMSSDDVVVDYRKPLLDVYVDVARYFLATGGIGLEILGDVRTDQESIPCSCKDDDALPSWLPNWDIDPQVEPLNNVQETPYESFNTAHHETLLTKSFIHLGNMVDAYEIMYDPMPGSLIDAAIVGSELHMTGILLDRLKFAIGPTWIGFEDLTVPRQWREALRSKGCEFKDASFARTLTQDATVYWDSTASRTCMRGGSVDLTWDTTAHADATLDEGFPSPRDIMLTMSWACHKRSPGFTDGGRLGLSPFYVHKGDLIAAISGGKALYAIRPTTAGRYIYIGECFLDEMMDGQAVEWAKQQKVEPGGIILV